MTEPVTIAFESQHEQEFHLNSSLEPSGQPTRVALYLRQNFPGYIITDRRVVNRWNHGNPYRIQYTIQPNPNPVAPRPDTSAEDYCWG